MSLARQDGDWLVEQSLRPGKPVMEMAGTVGQGGETEEVSQSMEVEVGV